MANHPPEETPAAGRDVSKDRSSSQAASAGTESVGIAVLGMHRSGTSATARLLGELGCDFGGVLLSGRDDNPDGYFEHKDVVESHNDFLRAVGREWDDPRPWRDEFSSPAADEARARLAEIYARDFASCELWVLKDPRLCRLLPLWDRIFDGADVRFTVVHRHPLAVARSLHRRDAMHRSRALLLWLRHVLEAELGTRGRRRAYFRFEELIADPGAVLPGVLQRLGLGRLLAESEDAADRTLEPSQVHHRADDDDRELLRTRFPWVARCHRALCRLDGAPSDVRSDEADILRQEMETTDRLYHDGMVTPLVQALVDANADRAGLRRSRDEKEQELASLRAEVEEIGREREVYVASLRETITRLEEEKKEQAIHAAAVEESLAEAQTYSRSLETRIEESEAASAEYVASLRESLETKDRHAAELRTRIEELERRERPES